MFAVGGTTGHRKAMFNLSKMTQHGCGTVCIVGTPGCSALASRRRLLSFVVVIFFVFLELGFFSEKQFLDPSSRGRIGRGFQQFTIVRDVLPCDKSIHGNLPRLRASCFRH